MGYLKGVDKHMNIILLDVEEYILPSGTMVPSLSVQAIKARATTTRVASQLLVRGDNVVMVYRR